MVGTKLSIEKMRCCLAMLREVEAREDERMRDPVYRAVVYGWACPVFYDSTGRLIPGGMIPLE